MYIVEVKYPYPYGTFTFEADNIKQIEEVLTDEYNEKCTYLANLICLSSIKAFDNTTNASTKRVYDTIKFVNGKFIVDTNKVNNQKLSKVRLTKSQQSYLFNSLLNRDYYYSLPPASLAKLKTLGYVKEVNNKNIVTDKGVELCSRIADKVLKYDKCKLIRNWGLLKEIFMFKRLIKSNNGLTNKGIKFFNPNEILKKCVICDKYDEGLEECVFGIACLISSASKKVVSLFLLHNYKYFVKCAKMRYEELQKSKKK